MPKQAVLLRTVLAAAFLLVSVASALASTPYKVYAPYWAWDNAFNGSNIAWYPGNGSNPQWLASFDFSCCNLYGYPASVRGYHYGYNPSGDTLFPKQMSTIKTIPAAFSYASSGTNLQGDFTYDMFLRNDNNVKSGQSNPQLEVMVWGGNASYPISTTGSPIVYSAVVSDGYTWDLYYGDNSAAGYYTYSFVPHRSSPPATLPTSGSVNVDLRLFFNVLKGRPNYSESMYLDVVEAGCEITDGNGYVQTTYFTVDAE
jgi:hypothetical protein